MTHGTVPLFLIWSNQHGAWWAPGGFGYTADIAAAGRFSHEEATKEAEGAGAYGPYADRISDDVVVLAPEFRWQGGPPPVDGPAVEFEAQLRRAYEAAMTALGIGETTEEDYRRFLERYEATTTGTP